MAVLHGFAARCLFGVAYLHNTKQGRLLCAVVSTPKSKNSAQIWHESTKSLWGQFNFWSLFLVLGIAIRFWWQKLLKVFRFWAIWRALREFDDHALRGKGGHFSTLLSLANSKHPSHAISRLSRFLSLFIAGSTAYDEVQRHHLHC